MPKLNVILTAKESKAFQSCLEWSRPFHQLISVAVSYSLSFLIADKTYDDVNSNEDLERLS